MNNSNSFNICPRCGTANSLNAKYCYQCGSQLKVPEEPVVCRNCHSVNTSMANFCRTCGASLKTGVQTKICPRCRKEVKIDQNQCGCGYSFAVVRSAKPAEVAVNPRTGIAYSEKQAVDEVSEERVSSGKGAGRAFAIVAVILILLFSYVLYSSTGYGFGAEPKSNMQLDFMKMLNGFVIPGADVESLQAVGFTDFVIFTLTSSLEAIANQVEVPFASWIILAVIAISAICLLAHLLVAIVRIFTGKRSQKGNLAFLILSIIYGLIAIFTLLVLLDVEFAKNWWLGLFVVKINGVDTTLAPGFGWVILAGYFIFFWLYSLLAKHRHPKAIEKE